MVAKINRGASLYGAIIYNQQKVNEDTAREFKERHLNRKSGG